MKTGPPVIIMRCGVCSLLGKRVDVTAELPEEIGCFEKFSFEVGFAGHQRRQRCNSTLRGGHGRPIYVRDGGHTGYVASGEGEGESLDGGVYLPSV